MTQPTNQQYEEYNKKREELETIEAARVRTWGYALGAYFTGPIWTAYIANRTNQWAPFWVGLGVGVLSLPLAVFDLGLVTSVPAAATCTIMMKNKSDEKRRKLNIHTPQQADMLKFNKGY